MAAHHGPREDLTSATVWCLPQIGERLQRWLGIPAAAGLKVLQHEGGRHGLVQLQHGEVVLVLARASVITQPPTWDPFADPVPTAISGTRAATP